MLRISYCLIALIVSLMNAVHCDKEVDERDNKTDIYLTPDGKIFNGKNAAVGQFPYQGFLQIRINFFSQALCGCTLISNKWAITAAHCVLGRSPPTVYLGVIDLKKLNSTTKIQASKVIVHPDYKKNNFPNDIAVVELSKEVTFSDTIQPADLPPASMSDPASIDNMMVLISGFGETGPNGGYLEDHSKEWPLKFNEVKMLPYKDCQTRTRFPNVVCVNRRVVNSGVCPGDSGGPLSIKLPNGKGRVFGVTSFLIGRCKDPNPAGFCYVGSYLPWIQANTGVAPPPS